MLVKGKRSGEFYENVRLVENCYVDSKGNKAAFVREVSDIYYSPEELQERIENAVKEHEETRRRMWQGFHDESVDLKKRIAELESDKQEADDLNEHLRDKLKRVEAERQPVEVSQDLAKVIEHYKEKQGIIWEYEIITDMYARDASCRESAYGSDFGKVIGSADLMEIIKRGYTVKPDQLRSTFSAIWQEYEDGHISQTEALDKITEVAKAHSRTKEGAAE